MNDDLISRKAAIDECNKRGAEHIGYAIAHLPSAQPTIDAEPVRRGKWVKDDIDKYKCSLCGKGNNYAYSWSISKGDELQDLYCPNCGAKMEA